MIFLFSMRLIMQLLCLSAEKSAPYPVIRVKKRETVVKLSKKNRDKKM